EDGNNVFSWAGPEVDLGTAEFCVGGDDPVDPVDPPAECSDLAVDISGGSWASEISWDIADSDGNLVASGVAGASSVCLNDGCYTVTGYDAYGDGWNGNVMNVTDEDGNNVFSWAGPEVDLGTAEFCVGGDDPVDPVDPPADCIDISYSVSPGSYPSEVSWAILDEDGNVVVEGGADESGVLCLDIACYTFMGMDSFGDGWNGAAASIVNGGNEILDFTFTIGDSAFADFCLSNDIEGCTDESASNYNPDATIDDDSCCYEDLVTINLYDSFGDGWSWAGVEGGMIFDGTYYPFLEGSLASNDFCLAPGCYTADLILDSYPGEASWDVVVGGEVIANGSSADLFFSTDPSCIVAGCDDEIACNYDPAANVNDGSCEYVSCAGCTDESSCNYDAAATLDDGSCDYSCVGCMDSTAINYDADATIACEDCCSYCEGAFAGSLNVGGGSWDAEIGWTLSLDGVVVASGVAGSTALCLEAGCYVLDMTDSFGDGWNGATYSFDGYDGSTAYSGDLNSAAAGDGVAVGTDYIDFNGGACTSGCTDAGACNYDDSAAFDDGSCDYSCVGCTNNTAANYDPNATIDSGECIFCDSGSFVMTVSMTDSFGDGWDGAEYFIFDLNSGAQVASGSLDAAFNGDLTAGYDLICLAPGCYNVQVTEGNFPTEVGISLTDQFGNNYGSFGAGATYPVDFLLTGTCGFEGCTSPTAINYNISATVDDGSCQEPPANDQLENAEPLFCGAYASGTLLYATDDQGLIGSQIGNANVATSGVWYVFNSDANQQVIASTCDTPSNEGDTDYTSDTKLHVYTMGADGSLNAIAGNDDGCATGLLSTVAFNAVTGSDYYIYVSEFSAFSPGNDFVLSVECIDCGDAPSNDDCDGAVAQVTGVTFTGSTCCASAEEMNLAWAGFGTAYGVWFTFNSSDYDTFYFDATNISNESIGFVMMEGGATCDDVVPFVGCQVTGTCAGSVEGFLPQLTPNTDYYFIIYNTDPTTCGEFEFTTTGINLGCTDATANNYDPDANQDDGSCDFDGVVPVNDICADAITLECNSVTTGSTGGSTSVGAPIGVEGCEVSPGTGVWYTFVGDGQLHNLSTCGSAIDSKINIYTATEDCGGGSIDTPPADACGDGLVTVNLSVGGGTWDSEIGWTLSDANGNVVDAGGAPFSGSYCLAEGDYTLDMTDAYGDGWNGGAATFSNGLGDVIGFASIETGAAASAVIAVGPYSMDPIFIAGDFACFASATTSDGTGACSLFDSDDVNFEFVSEPGVLYYVYVGAQDADGNPVTDDNGTFDLVFDCTPVVEGCMNPAACNYDVNANVSNDTCDFWSCVCEGEGVAVMLNMVDAFGDGWNNAGYTITDLMGNLVAEGSLDDAQFFVDNDNFAGPENGFDMICLPAGCYLINVTPGDWAAEVSWDIMLEDGTLLAAGGAPTDNLTISVGGAVCGCTDAGACNYDETATDEDGSCEYETCAGCTDAASCSYDESATIDDGSCCYSNCLDIQMFDSFGDGWNGASYVLTSVDGVEVGTGTIDVGSNATDSYCLADGCYTISVDEGSWPTEITWNVVGAFGGLVSGVAGSEVTFNVGSGDQCVVGCDISCACNYDPAANISDVAQCVFEGCDGCTYPDASNYDEAAVSDNGTCEFDIANPCPADLNGDGSITTGDLLIFLGAFGTICE
ncbi:MAG: hypothetical protein CL847_01505, partial [Crocinitomicaceae bacterium]|nr:hypothetical protein [Crocinitomicaceae bacterium]